MAEPVFELDGVSYAYDTHAEVLVDIDLTVVSGERVALLGANGCGKSTLLRILDGLLFAARGSVQAFGRPLSSSSMEDDRAVRELRSRVGLVFQNAETQLFCATVREELAFGPACLGLSPAEVEARVDDVLTLLELDALADRAPHALSGGQKKKVAIASVLTMNPSVLLLDEPTAALDPRTQHWLLDLLAQLHDAGRTLIVATHDLAQLPLLADRAVVFDEAHRIARDAGVLEVLADDALLESVNLVHRHDHGHGALRHHHEHGAAHHR